MTNNLKLTVALAMVCLLSACAVPSAVPIPSSTSLASSQLSSSAPMPPAPALPSPSPPEMPAPAEHTGNTYIQGLATDAVEKLSLGGRDDFGQVQAAYEYLIATTYFAPPLGLDSWQLHEGKQPDYIENRALSPLAYGVGSCEDYAAAMVLVLQQLGFEARYVPGITISVQGDFVDHAWTAVQIRGDWYHLDPQLEDNIMREDILRYRYFLKNDKEMLIDHRWGKNLLEYAHLSEAQRQEVENSYLLPACNKIYPAVTPQKLNSAPKPNLGALTTDIAAVRAAYEAEHGKLPKAVLDIIPPVFGNAGYGPPD